MLHQFPQVSIETPGNFLCPSYFYTGILYNKNDIRTITDVVPGSPASKAGILNGDVIIGINGNKIPSSYATCVKYQYVNAVQYDYEREYAENIKYAERVGYGLKYLVYFPYLENRSVAFIVNRAGKKLSFDIIPETRQLFKIFQ